MAEIKNWFVRAEEPGEEHSRFIDLAPTDKADEEGVYSAALLFATGNPRISNIALTGPYGSGKSSIIKSFLKRYRRPVLQISLAAFLPEATATGGAVNKQEIERSILQQMLYGADANQLPLSRFKRIKSPSKWAIPLSLYAVFGVVACWHLFVKRDDIADGKFLMPLAASNWPNFVWFGVGASFIWLAVYHAYKASFGVSLKSISLKDIEITPAPTNQESILNRHLDEIIYFFQSTKYDLVIIEDLDRFNDPDIFVTFREINSLVNENAGVKRAIRFLYALRDDMFVNTDRTKFFEFIVPVIPIINSSNSIDKVLEQGKRLSLDSRLDRQFLREVSRYLNDLRLIQNIFNEYAVYVANLETDGDNVLDANKLLAILIYKNIFPSDFEKLHRRKGHLADILDRHEEYIASGEAAIKAEIERIEGEIDEAERRIPADLSELRRIYAMALIEKLPSHTAYIMHNGQTPIEMGSIAKSDAFDQIIATQTLMIRNVNGYNTNVSIAGLEAEVDSARTYRDRRKGIEKRGVEYRDAAARKVRALRDRASTLRSAKFNEIVRLNANDLGDIFAAFGDDSELARYLILEGYLDDTYYQYTSLFHSGRLSPNDNKFLIQVRGFIIPDPDFPIDNVKEVVAAMRDEDFRQHYVLNVKIVDCLLGDELVYADQVAKMFEVLSTDFGASNAFFKSYYASGLAVSKLVAGLEAAWPGFIPTVLAEPDYLVHIGQVIAHLPEPALRSLPAKHPEISTFVSENLARILSLGIDIDPARLMPLGIEVGELQSVEGFPGIVRFLFENGFYTITTGNLELIAGSVLGFGDLSALRAENYTTITAIGNPTLLSRVERGFEDYLKNVLLALDGNTREGVAAILSIMARDDVDPDDRSTFFGRQTATLPSLAGVPTDFHPLVFQSGRIEPIWANCLAFINSDAFDGSALTSYLETDRALAALSNEAIPNDDEASSLRTFLINDDGLREATYRTYVKGLPRTFVKFPAQLPPAKLRIVVEECKVEFSSENVDFLRDHLDLEILFVVKNIASYLANQEAFSFGDDFREMLLGESIGDADKLAIIQTMDLTSLAEHPPRAAKVGHILHRTGADVDALSAASARAIILNSSPVAVQIAMFNRCQMMFTDGEVREILSSLPRPFSEIKNGYYSPRVEKTEVNVTLVKWLDKRNIISSWNDTFFGDDIRVNTYRKDHGG